MSDAHTAMRVSRHDLERFMDEALARRGADDASRQAVIRALVTASRWGTDSHGLRLLPHYLEALAGGRINPRPSPRFRRRLPATGHLDGDHAIGHLAGYTAMQYAVDMAREVGIGAVAVANSSHYGAAGCYAVAAAEQGMLGLTVSNSDPFVLLHQSQRAFHGTNPIAFAAPLAGGKPYVLDMATSSVPWNRVQQYAAIGRRLPDQVAANAAGKVTCVADEVAALLPLGGGEFGFKGAALGGLAEILSSTLSGMLHGFRLLPMTGDDMATPRGVSHFFLAINPAGFVELEQFTAGLADYLTDLRAQPAALDGEVLAPGDREWRCMARRDAEGIPLDRANRDAYAELAECLEIAPLTPLE